MVAAYLTPVSLWRELLTNNQMKKIIATIARMIIISFLWCLGAWTAVALPTKVSKSGHRGEAVYSVVELGVTSESTQGSDAGCQASERQRLPRPDANSDTQPRGSASLRWFQMSDRGCEVSFWTAAPAITAKHGTALSATSSFTRRKCTTVFGDAKGRSCVRPGLQTEEAA